jgi:hypothetical protein
MTATLPTQYPFPVAPGGMRHANATRPLRGPPQAFVRQPDLGFAPSVAQVLGFGAGAGAFIRNNGSDADQSQGLIVVRCGLNPAASGSVMLSFPIAPIAGQYVGLADWATFGSPAIGGNIISFTWTGTRPLLSNEILLMAYQWAVSQ